MVKTSLVATINKPLSRSGKEFFTLGGVVNWLEVRADIVGDVDTDRLRSHVNGVSLIYALRSRAYGGSFDGSRSERQKRLLTAADYYDLVELEAHDDLHSELLDRIPPQKRLVSWRGIENDPSRLENKVKELSAVEASIYKLVTVAKQSGDELVPLLFLKSLSPIGHSNVIAFAEGQGTLWSRLLAPYFGAPFVFGTVEDDKTNLDEPSVRRLIEDYGLPYLPLLPEIYGIVGSPISLSLSPRLHNAAYRAARYSALFLPFHVEYFHDFWQRVVLSGGLEKLGLSINGLTVVSPHKAVAIDEAGVVSSLIVRRTRSTNIFLRNDGYWEADTTDSEIVTTAIEEHGIDVRGKKAAVVGCGGAGRVIAATLDEAGAQVTLVNRSPERAIKSSRLLNLPFMLLSDFCVEDFSIVVNATPVGRAEDELPFEIDRLGKDALVIDLVYRQTSPRQTSTPLVSGARARGNSVIDGKEVLISEVRRQFQMMTGMEMPGDLARLVLKLESQSTELATAG